MLCTFGRVHLNCSLSTLVMTTVSKSSSVITGSPEPIEEVFSESELPISEPRMFDTEKN